MYELPQFNFPHSKKISKTLKNSFWGPAVLTIIVVSIVSFYTNGNAANLLDQIVSFFQKNIIGNNTVTLNPTTEKQKAQIQYNSPGASYEQTIIEAVKKASPSVVSIVISKNLPVYERNFIDPFENFPDFVPDTPFEFKIPEYTQKGTQKQDVGAGSGFIVSEDGLILTNKHVVIDKQAEYTVFNNEGKKYLAKVLALDPVQDLALIKIQPLKNGEQTEKFPAIALSDSSQIQIGQTAIAIGNALGEFRNTVSVGIVSGLGRTISASGNQGFSETLEGIIQTDAAINFGNSGGPLLNSKGEVIGVNVATAQGAQTIGFAIPINVAKKDIEQVIRTNTIVYPFLGIRYVVVNEQVKQKFNLSVDYGALVLGGENGEPAITPNSGAEKAGIKEHDVVLELNGEKINQENSLSRIIAKYNPGKKVTLKILRDNQEITAEAILGQRN